LAIGNEGMINRLKYRRDVQQGFTGKRPAIEKGEIIKKQLAHADLLDDKDRNPDWGFNCLHYSVSEAAGTLDIMILNKKH